MSADDDYARLDGKVASLSAALLARKGGASPSLKRFANSRANNPFTEDGRACPADGKSCGATSTPRRASVTLRLAVPDFLRLKLAAGLFERTSQSILIEALTLYLDQRGVERFEDCPCLQKAAGRAEQR